MYTSRYFAITFEYRNVSFQVIVQQPPGYPGKWPKIRCIYLKKKLTPTNFSDIKVDSSSSQSIKRAVIEFNVHSNSCKSIEIASRKGLNKLLQKHSRSYILSIMIKKAQLCFEKHVEALGNFDRKKRTFWGRDREQSYVTM